MSSIGSIGVNVYANVNPLVSGLKKGRREVNSFALSVGNLGAALKRSLGAGVGRWFGLGAGGTGLFAGVMAMRKITSTAREMREELDRSRKTGTAHNLPFSNDDIELVRRYDASVAGLHKTFKTLWQMITVQAAPALMAVTDALQGKGFVQQPGQRSAFSGPFDQILGNLSDAEVRRASQQWAGISEKGPPGSRSAFGATLGIAPSQFDTQSFEDALHRRMDTIAAGVTERHKATGLAAPHMTPSELAAREQGKINAALAPFLALAAGARALATQPWWQKPEDPLALFDVVAPNGRPGGGRAPEGGFHALEAGTAEAFSQFRRSAEQDKGLGVANQQLQVAKESKKTLEQIRDKQAQPLEVVSIE